MAYCTTSDLQASLGADWYLRLADRDGDGTADSSAVTAAIAWGDAIIDARLADAYGTPFTGSIAEVVKGLSVDLAVWRLVVANAGATQVPTAPYRTRFDDAMRLLADLARNRDARLPSATPRPTGDADADEYVYVGDGAHVWSDAADAETAPIGF